MDKTKFKTGNFRPRNPEKYKGNDINKILFRSSWEETFCKFCDNNPNIVRWAFESIVVKYIKPTDGKIHKYLPDFWIAVKDRKGNITEEIIEIKPLKFTKSPTTRGKKQQTILTEQRTFNINQAKWRAAQNFCSKYGMKFRLITEKEIFGKGPQKNANRNKRSNSRTRTQSRRNTGNRRRNNTGSIKRKTNRTRTRS